MLPSLGEIGGSVGQIMDKWVKDPWVRRLIDLECFLLSGLKANGTVAPEVAFMFGERSNSVIEYPIGGSAARNSSTCVALFLSSAWRVAIWAAFRPNLFR